MEGGAASTRALSPRADRLGDASAAASQPSAFPPHAREHLMADVVDLIADCSKAWSAASAGEYARAGRGAEDSRETLLLDLLEAVGEYFVVESTCCLHEMHVIERAKLNCPQPLHSQSIWLLIVRALFESTFTESSGTTSFSGIRLACDLSRFSKSAICSSALSPP
eukprot:CAMPEP_0182849530 /NCGR_PEP_ID=MMETSP0006_2-20121128/29609_1 /TAXON_ID=97485 /ORGANISM="Prymnesium parvum, Strain Texoma1" /LENGTH=165 /DNA_ID=CAMNT_0024980073 /DNA_START=287 /DNA_END=783 /DNA_ORIENTATION=-